MGFSTAGDAGDGIPLSEKGVANGVATLDGTATVPVAQLPPGSGLPVDDTTSIVQDPVDNTKLMRIDVGSVTTGTTRVLTMPDADITPDDTGATRGHAVLAGQAGGQTLVGGTAASDNLVLRSTSNATKGDVVIADVATFEDDQITFTQPTAGTAIGGGSAAALRSVSTGPAVEIRETDAALDEKSWDFLGGGGTLSFRAVNDANSASTPYLQVDRTGTTIDSVQFLNGHVSVGSTLISSIFTDANSQSLDDLTVSSDSAVVGVDKAPDLTLHNESQTTNNSNLIAFSSKNTTLSNVAYAVISGIAGARNATFFPGELAFFTRNNLSSAMPERMRIGSSGFVGIGTTSPDRGLVVSGTTSDSTTITLRNFGGTPRVALVRANGTEASPTAVLSGQGLGFYQFRGHNGSSFQTGAVIRSDATENWSGSAEGNNLIFRTTANGTTSNSIRMTIEQSGVINIPNLGASLDVQTDGSSNLITVSDARAKHIHGPVPYGLAEVAQLRPVLFNYKTDPEGSRVNIGFTAQDVQRVIPEAVGLSGDGERLGLNSRGILAALVNAVRELKSENDTLRGMIVA